MEIRIGDKVKLLPLEEIDVDIDPGFVDNMQKYAGNVVTISHILKEDGIFFIEEDTYEYTTKWVDCIVSRDFSDIKLPNEDSCDPLVVNEDGGKKCDKFKTDWDLLPIESVEEILKVLMFGAKKYGRENWKKVEDVRYYNAILRHITAYRKGEKLDPETGISHLAHCGCNILFLLYKELMEESNEY